MTSKQFLLIAVLGISSLAGTAQAMDPCKPHEQNPAMALLRSPGERVWDSVSAIYSYKNPHCGRTVQKFLPHSPQSLQRQLSQDSARRLQHGISKRKHRPNLRRAMEATLKALPEYNSRKASYKKPFNEVIDDACMLALATARLAPRSERIEQAVDNLRTVINDEGCGSDLRQQSLMDMFSRTPSTASTATTRTTSSGSAQPGPAAAAAAE